MSWLCGGGLGVRNPVYVHEILEGESSVEVALEALPAFTLLNPDDNAATAASAARPPPSQCVTT